MWHIVIVPLLMLMILLMNIPISDIYAENGEYSKYDSLKLRHATNPHVCLFEVNPELYDWYKYMFINVFLESQKSITKIVLGEDYSSSTINRVQESYPLSENTIRNIILHEFGHGLGLAHFNLNRSMQGYTQSVMTPTISAFDENQILSVTYIDLVMIGKVYGENGWKKPVPVFHIKGCHISDSYIFKCY